MRFDSLHCALLAIVVLLAVYGFGSGTFREGCEGCAKACPSLCPDSCTTSINGSVHCGATI